MGNTYTDNQVLSGSWAQVWVDGELWAEASGITAKITEKRTDVQVGIDTGSKMTALKGEGAITVDHVYTSKMRLVENKLKGKDTLVQIIAKIDDPDSVGGQVERWVFNDAKFTETPIIEAKRGEISTKSWPFIFPATKAKCLDAIA